MAQKPDGGPAFPPNSSTEGERGMTLRDWFAGQALMNIHGTNPNLPGSPASMVAFPEPEELADRQAKWAYLVADALIAERSK